MAGQRPGRYPVKNARLWRELDAAAAPHAIEWRWVRGHSGNKGNERADALSRKGMAPYLNNGAGA